MSKQEQSEEQAHGTSAAARVIPKPMIKPKKLTEVDHAVHHWNASHEIRTEVVRVDDFGHLHKTVTTSRAWVMPSGTAVVMVEDMSGAYKLSRIWERSAFNDLASELCTEGEEPVSV